MPINCTLFREQMVSGCADPYSSVCCPRIDVVNRASCLCPDEIATIENDGVSHGLQLQSLLIIPTAAVS